jgi:GNAT superfamily N-acetyltransferase
MASGYRIRKARSDDLAPLPAIERAAGKLFADVDLGGITDDDTTTLEDFSVCWGNGLLWVAVDGQDAPVGFAFVEMIDGIAHLDELDVHPTHGRRGLGTALVEAVIDWARSQGLAGVTLTTFRDVAWNMPFYSRMGFHVLDASELTPELREVVAAETRRGLPPEKRVVMRVDLRDR